jgi:hypothetical protein
MVFFLYFEIQANFNNSKKTPCTELGPARCYSTSRSNRQRLARVRIELGRDRPSSSAVPADHGHLPPDFHAQHMQPPPMYSASSQHPDAGPACGTAARPPAISRPTLPTSHHFRSMRRACSHQPCTLTPRPQSGREADHSSPHSYRRAPAFPLDPAIATVPRPPSTASSGAPPAPSTLPIASPELGGALQPHQPCQRQPVDPLTGAPLRPIIIAAASPPR